ncbi:MAG TPA: FtsW/RodA/SpoVE family cell cycle protein [Thermomicrobiales bacterium]|nr:FtsW/RodA/SpoVE family cell cycle protein [Thermomicrobiales bacterium]
MRFRPTFRGTEFNLLLIPGALAIVGSLTIFLVGTGSVDWTWGDIWISLAAAAAVLLVSITFGLRGFRGDQVMFPITATLAIIGMLMIQRLHPDLVEIDEGYSTLAQRHLLYLGAGLVGMWLIVMFSGPLKVANWLRKYKYTWLLVTLALQAATFFIGTEVGGARLWINLGPIQIQPSELSKITLVIFLASYLDEKRDLIGSSWQVGRFKLPPIPYLVPMGIMWAASLMLLVILNDLGPALLFFGIFLVMLYLATGRLVYVGVGMGTFAVACWLAWTYFSRIEVRVNNWLDPFWDPYGFGYQPIQSDYALSAGGIFGTGFGQGHPTFISQVQTDYIFSAIGEELGLLGTLALIALYFLWVVRSYIIAIRADDGFVQLCVAGLATSLGIQTIIIIGGVTRLIPLTGITLPFISYGGSSLVTNFGVLALILYFSSLPRRV